MAERILLIVLLTVLGASEAAAQIFGSVPRVEPRAHVGANLQVAFPVGEFADHAGRGFGFGGHLLFRLDREGWAGLRLEGQLLNYGEERQRVQLSPTVGGRVQVDLTTRNNIMFLGLGPQLVLPGRALRPYAYGGGGLAYFVTESSVRGAGREEAFGRTTNFDDLVLSVGAGGGVYLPIPLGRENVVIDLGARFHHNGPARYLVPGSIQDQTDGTISFEPIHGVADLVSVYLGVSASLRARTIGPRRR